MAELTAGGGPGAAVSGRVAHDLCFSSVAVHTLKHLLISMSEFGDKLPASTVIYALAAIAATLYTVR
jgi:hypothetical protein